ncbi:MAG: HD domain-containing protein [Promethearchaeota archaeon]
MDKINDPIYGLIKINPIESEIIDTLVFQRLRGIKQLSMAHFVYPTAIHTRFSHSIGVMHVADMIFSTLKKIYDSKYGKHLNQKARKNLRMAALLHDVGHFPFSHTLEFENISGKENQKEEENTRPFYYNNHENITTFIIENSHIKEILESDEDYEIDFISALIKGDSTTNLILNNLIHWELDADRMDYILRDCYFTGVSFGGIDYKYLIENFKIIDEEDPHLEISYKAARSIENFLIARYSLYDRVYFHEKIRYFDYLLRELTLNFVDQVFPSYLISEKQFREELIENNAINFFDFNDNGVKRVFNKIFKEDKNEEKLNQKIKSDLEAIIYRKKNDKIYSKSYITAKKEIDMVGRFKQIENILNEIDKNFGTAEANIRLNRPKNRFTSYETPNYNIWTSSYTDMEAIKEKQKRTILVIDKQNQTHSFFNWTGSYFRDIFDKKNYRNDIYIRKSSPNLISKFESETIEKINEILEE